MKLFIKTSGIVDSCDSNINWIFLIFQTILKFISLLESISGNAKIKASSAAIESIC